MFSNMKPAERKLLEACQKGEMLDLGNERPVKKTADNEISGEFLRALILNNNQLIINEKWEEYILKIDPKGIMFSGVYVSGKFDFFSCSTDLPFIFMNSFFQNEIILIDSKIKLLILSRSKIISIIAQRLICESSVFLSNGFEAQGEVNFNSAQIAGDLVCGNGEFNNKAGYALYCNGIKISGSVFLNNKFKSIGMISFAFAKIEKNLDCCDAKFDNYYENKYSLLFNGAKINGYVFLKNTFSKGEVNFGSAQIGMDLDCTNGNFINEFASGKSLNCFRLEAGGKVFLKNNFKSIGIVNFNSSQIGDNFDCSRAKFFNDFTCNGAKIIGAVFLKDGFESKGEVDFTSSEIGSLECTGGKFLNEKIALSFNSAKINGMVFFNDGFESNGEIDFTSAEILGNLDCGKGKFNANLSKKALNFEGVKINKNVFFNNNFKSNGIIDFGYSIIGNTFEFSKLCIGGKLILTSAKINIIWIDDNFWKDDEFKNIQLDGLEYNHLSGKSVDSKTLSSWFEKMSKEDDFKPQPYKQLAKVLRNMGHNEDADDIMIKYNDIITSKTENCFIKDLKQIYGFTSGYGYKPMRIVYLMLSIWFVCGLFFLQASKIAVFAPTNPLIFQKKDFYDCYISGLGTPIKDLINDENYDETNNWILNKNLEGEYTTFQPFWYSLDTLLPILELQMDKDWGVYIPPSSEETTLNHITRWVVWFEILAGWYFSLILVAILSGLAKNEKD